MLWRRSSAAGPVLLEMAEGELNAAKQRKILEDNPAAVHNCGTE